MEPFIGEIRCFGFTFPPRSYMQCNGQLLPIQQYAALFSILGTTYGGNGTTNFALPNLQGSIPMHWGNGSGGFTTVIGEVLGSTTITLNQTEIPMHTHVPVAAQIVQGATGERTAVPTSSAFLSTSAAPNVVYQTSPTSATAAFSPKAISPFGGSQPHQNMQPFLVLNFCIAIEGIFPSRN